MKIETARLILREYTLDDFDALYEIVSDTETMRHYPEPFDEARTRNWIEWNLKNYAEYGFGLWAVVLKETQEFIGDCGITMQNIDGEVLPEIGYHIHKKYRRRGFGSEAAKAVRDWAFENTKYDCLYSYMKYTNVGSYSTAAAIGMKKIKEYPDEKNGVSYAYAITRGEWEELKKKKEALIIIDVQNDYFPGGACELCNAYEAEKKIQSLIKESRAQNRPVVYIQHINPPEETFFLEGTHGCEISERIKPLPGDKIIVKYLPNSFHKTELDSYLKENGITKLIVCGMMTHMCVDTTVRAAMDYGYEVELVADGCATMDLEISGEIISAQIVQKTFLASLKDVFAKIV